MDIFSTKLSLSDVKYTDIFKEINSESNNNNISFEHNSKNKNDLINYIQNLDDVRADKWGCLFLLTQKNEFAQKFKQIIIEEAKTGKFLKKNGHPNPGQKRIADRVHYYILLNKELPNLFNNHEKYIILNWFKQINRQILNPAITDYVYAILFKQKSLGPYYNQEIGFGLLALLTEAIKEIDPELAETNREMTKKHAVGWSNNFRNTDDGISYQQNTWIQNAYWLYQYMESGNLEYAKWSFDWILEQSPLQDGGVHPNYNSQTREPAINAMLLGQSMFNDGKYKYIAENMLDYLTQNKIDVQSCVGLELWNDEVDSLQPNINSHIIYGPTGTNAKPKKMQPDKLVIRKIINNQELFILVNLRSSGWHRYNGSGSVILAQYGDNMLLKDKLNNTNHFWLPKKKADHRDKKITIEELNIYQPLSRGIERLFYYLFSFDNTLAYKNYDKFIDNIDTKDPEHVKIILDKNNILHLEINNQKIKIYYNNEANTLLNYSFL